MISLSDALSEIVVPAVREVFRKGEVSQLSVELLARDAFGARVVLTLTAVGESFHDEIVQGNVEGVTVEEWRERLRSNLADFVAESHFGWGQDRGV